MLFLLSPAKVNLGLWVLGKREDGYHEIFTIYQTVSLFDEISIKEGPLKVKTSDHIPEKENLVYKALKLMEERIGKRIEFSIHIKKNIPKGAGLGGGSSNCATVLKVINQLLGEPLSFEELRDVLKQVSTDSVFFLYGGTAIGRGRGDLIEPIKPIDLTLTLIYPMVEVSTKRIYSAVREETLTDKLEEDKIINSLLEGDFSLIENRLGMLAVELFPEVGEVFRFLEYLGKRPLVSGSGSCVFYIGEATEDIKRGATLRGWRVYEVKSYYGV